MAEETNTGLAIPGDIAVDTAPPTEARPLSPAAKPDAAGFYWGTGRRKSAVARVRLRPAGDGGGKFTVNGREVDAYFNEPQDRQGVRFPLEATETAGNLEIHVRVEGGGVTGQAGAIRMGVARALKGYDPSLEPILRDHALLTRDPRKVERKKYGQSGARRRFQFSKR